jgi:hypothetical protein
VYRDLASGLDEHDRAVGSILIVEQLVEACSQEVLLARQPEAAPAARWQAIGRFHDDLHEIWRHMDRARDDLARRGSNTVAFDEMRPHARRASTDVENESALDARPLDDARAALEALVLAVPGTDWKAIAKRTQGLVEAPIARRRRQRWGIAGVVAGVAFVMTTWIFAITPTKKPDPRAAMRQELVQIAEQRKVKIAELEVELGTSCAPAQAHELVRLLVLDGQIDQARAFGESYTERCGDDSIVEHWANAPRPRPRY